jgi:P27 family predicted phage terminase small subunit
VPPAPIWLSEDARKVYKKTADVLTKHHPEHLQFLDEAVLGVYAQSYAAVARLEKEIEAEGETYETSTGNQRQNPKVQIRNEAVKRLMQATSKLGFNPVDRQRLGASLAPPRVKDAADRFLEGG